MELKSFWPTVLAVITALVIAFVIARTFKWARMKRGGNRQLPGNQQNTMQQPQQQLIMQQPVAAQMPASFKPTNSIPQQNMPYNFY